MEYQTFTTFYQIKTVALKLILKSLKGTTSNMNRIILIILTAFFILNLNAQELPNCKNCPFYKEIKQTVKEVEKRGAMQLYSTPRPLGYNKQQFEGTLNKLGLVYLGADATHIKYTTKEAYAQHLAKKDKEEKARSLSNQEIYQNNTRNANSESSSDNYKNYKTNGFYLFSADNIRAYVFGTNLNPDRYRTNERALFAVKFYTDGGAVMIHSIRRSFHNYLTDQAYPVFCIKYNNEDYFKDFLIRINSPQFDKDQIHRISKHYQYKIKGSSSQDDLYPLYGSEIEGAFYFENGTNSKYRSTGRPLTDADRENRIQINRFMLNGLNLTLNQSIINADTKAIVAQADEMDLTFEKYIEVEECSTKYFADIEQKKLEKQKAEEEDKNRRRLQQEQFYLARQKRAVEFEKNRLIKLSEATIGDRICYSQNWVHTESYAGFFGFGSSTNEIHYTMMVIAYIERIEGSKMQVRIANIESSDDKKYETPKYKGVGMTEGSIHWISPTSDKGWLICE